ncbi:MAG: hypothetical protein RO469_08060 [Thermincola sp.]|jgi:hypothetical protein|nr:hypothetical protein [Thermincola sp.]MDT3701718.1 hypothetical protein [Thermincola sp.]
MRMKKTLVYLVTAILIMSLSTNAFAYSLDQLIPAPGSGAAGSVSVTNVSTNLSWTYTNPSYDRKLFYSNDPEWIYSGNPTGILYQDSAISGTGMFRIYWGHRNMTGSSKYIGFTITNNTGQTVDVKLGKRAHAESSASLNSDQMGRKVLQDWLASSSTEYQYAQLTNGQTCRVSFLVPDQQYSTGMYDVNIRDLSGNLVKTDTGILTKTFISSSSSTVPTNILQTNMPQLGRGRLDHASKYLTWNASNGQEISFTSSVTNSWSVPSNDLDIGYSQLDGQYFNLYGSYGQDLNITVNLNGSSAIVLSPGWEQRPYYGDYSDDDLTALVSGRGVVAKTVPYKQGWVLKTGVSGNQITVQTGLPGYHLAPLHLAVIT